MNKVSIKLQVYFEETIWIGVFEIYQEDVLNVCKIRFEKEPKDYDVYHFILESYQTLSFHTSNAQIGMQEKEVGFKRKH